MLTARLMFVSIIGVSTLAHTPASAAPERTPDQARAGDVEWIVLIYLLQELEVILFGDDVPPARGDGFAPPEQAQAEAEASAYVATDAAEGIRSGLTPSEIDDADALLDDTIGWLDTNPGGIDASVEADLRATIADQRVELGL